MSYKNIIYVKLEKRLLNDARWYTMSEEAQLMYVRLIMLAAETYNRIPKNVKTLKKAFRTKMRLKKLSKALEEIKVNFPRFKETYRFFYFDEFHEKTNFIPDKISKLVHETATKIGENSDQKMPVLQRKV